MEAPTPKAFFTNSIHQNFEYESEQTINTDKDNYKILLGTNKEKNILSIKTISEKSKNLFFYQSQFNLNELHHLSKNLYHYQTIEDLKISFPKFKKRVYEKDEELIIELHLFNPEGEEEISNLCCQKIYYDKLKVIKELSNEINLLKKSNNQKDQEIDGLKKEISEKNELINKLNTNNNNCINEMNIMKQNLLVIQNEKIQLNTKNSYLSQQNFNLQKQNFNLQQLNNQKISEYNNLSQQFIKLKEDYKKLELKCEYLEKEKKSNMIDTFPGDNSNIIDSMSDLQFIFNYMRKIDKSFQFNYLKLLYKGSRDGDRTKTCHELCDNKQNVLIIIKSDIDNIFGGYSKIGFKASNKPEYLIDNDCFLFSFDLKKIFPCVKNKNNISHITADCGLCFTGSLGFFDNFMKTYDNCIYPRIKEYFNKLDEPYEINGGRDKFMCKELEVYQFT